MSEHVPAWKKAGLAVETVTDDSATSASTNNGTKRASNAADDKEKKPPKRQKLPKDKRAPPPESDHLVYIKTFVDDKPSWKFNTVSQQWILKNLFNEQVPSEYDDYVIKYVSTVKGGARDRVVDSAKQIISDNNEYVQWLNAEDDDDDEEDKKKDADGDEEMKEEKENKNKASKKRVPRHFVKRAHSLVSEMTGEEPDVDWEPENAEEVSTKPDFIVQDVKKQYNESFSEDTVPQTDLESFDEAQKNDKLLDKSVKKIEKDEKDSKDAAPKQDFIVKDVKKQTEEDFTEGRPEETPAEEFAAAKKLDKELDEAVDNLHKAEAKGSHKETKKDSKKGSKGSKKSGKTEDAPEQDFIVKDVKKQNEEDFTEGVPEETPAEEFANAEKLDKELDKAVDQLHKAEAKGKKSSSSKKGDKKTKSPKQDFIVKDVKKQYEEDFTEGLAEETPAEEFENAEKKDKILDKAVKKIDKSRKAKSAAKDKIKK